MARRARHVRNLDEAEISDDVVGFVDEMAVEANTNTARLWSFGKPVRRVATYVKAKVSGFYCLNGESLIEFPESNKTEDFASFLKKIREANPEKRIVIILDNFRTHHAKKVKEEAKRMNIALVYLPPYSPDLNPIEFEWKDMKKELAKFLSFDEVERNVKSIAERLMRERKCSYMGSWVEKFGDVVRIVQGLVK